MLTCMGNEHCEFDWSTCLRPAVGFPRAKYIYTKSSSFSVIQMFCRKNRKGTFLCFLPFFFVILKWITHSRARQIGKLEHVFCCTHYVKKWRKAATVAGGVWTYCIWDDKSQIWFQLEINTRQWDAIVFIKQCRSDLKTIAKSDPLFLMVCLSERRSGLSKWFPFVFAQRHDAFVQGSQSSVWTAGTYTKHQLKTLICRNELRVTDRENDHKCDGMCDHQSSMIILVRTERGPLQERTQSS